MLNDALLLIDNDGLIESRYTEYVFVVVRPTLSVATTVNVFDVLALSVLEIDQLEPDTVAIVPFTLTWAIPEPASDTVPFSVNEEDVK